MEYVMDLYDTNIRKAIDTCIEKDGYRVGIACMAKNIEIESKILHDILHDTDNIEQYVQKFIRGRDRCEVWFKNGSIIRIINASTSARGYRVNSLLIDTKIPSEVVRCVLMPFLVKYYERE